MFYHLYADYVLREDRRIGNKHGSYTTLVVPIGIRLAQKGFVRVSDEGASVLDSGYGQIPYGGSDSSQAELVANFVQGNGDCRYN